MQSDLLPLYEPETKKVIDILNALEECEVVVSIYDLSKKVNYSAQTITHYLCSLKNIITSNKLDKLHLSILNKGKLSWYVDDMSQYRFLRNHLIQMSPIIQFGIDLVLGKSVNHQEFLTKHFLSESTFIRRLTPLKKRFEFFSIHIKKERGEYFLVGDELMIRRLAKESLLDIYSEEDWPFKSYNKQIIEKKLCACLMLENKPESEQQSFLKCDLFRNLLFDLTIQFYRIDSNNIVEIPEGLLRDKILLDLIEDDKLNLWSKLFENENEKLYFLFSIMSYDKIIEIPIGNRLFYVLKESDTKISNFIDVAMEKIRKNFLPLLNNQDIYPIIATIHIQNNLFPKWIGFFDQKPILKRVTNLKKYLDKYFYELLEFDPLLISEPFTGLYLGYISLYVLFDNLTTNEKIIKISLKNESSVIELKVAEKIITDCFSPFYNISFDSSTPDLIIHVNSRQNYLHFDKKTATVTCYIDSVLIPKNMSTIRDGLAKFDSL